MGTLMSGFVGAIIAVVLTKCIESVVFLWRRKSLYRAIWAECQYNLGVAKEMLDGMVNHNGTFKRMSVEFFKEMRLQAVQYSLDKHLLRSLSHLIVDLELYNREADCIFDGHSESVVYAGVSGEDEICIARRPIPTNLSPIVKEACKGVTNSSESVIEMVNRQIKL